MDANINKVREMENDFIGWLGINGNKSIVKNGGNNTLPGIVSLSFENEDGEAMLHRLDLRGICISTGSACNSGKSIVSHVLRAIGLDEKYVKGTIRISFGKDNTKEEVRYIADEINKIAMNRGR